MNKNIIIISVAIAVVLIGAFYFFGVMPQSSQPGKLDAFAKCLADKGEKMYGAFWCPHCTAQKELFGKSADAVPYVECDSKGKNAQPQVCLEKAIKVYPTWIRSDGTVYEGEQSLEELSKYSGCPLPGLADAPQEAAGE